MDRVSRWIVSARFHTEIIPFRVYNAVDWFLGGNFKFYQDDITVGLASLLGGDSVYL